MTGPGSDWKAPETPDVAPPAVRWVPPAPAPGPGPGVAWAGYGERVAAYLIDGFIVSLLFIVPIFGLFAVLLGSVGYSAGGGPVLGAGAAAAGIGFLALMLVAIAVGIGYFPFFWARGGQTPGMRVFGIRVVRDSDGGRVGVGSAIMRLLGVWVSAAVFYIGFIWVFTDKRRRGWHDLMAGTVVIKDPGR